MGCSDVPLEVRSVGRYVIPTRLARPRLADLLTEGNDAHASVGEGEKPCPCCLTKVKSSTLSRRKLFPRAKKTSTMVSRCAAERAKPLTFPLFVTLGRHR